MPAVEDIEDVKEEIRKNIGAVKNHCPCGCTNESLDEHGYCKHLVGFTNGPGAIGDRIEQVVINPETELCFVNGFHKRKHHIPPSAEVVKKGDKIINPEEIQFVNGVRNIAKKWVSSRVYREKQEPVKQAS